MRPYSRRGFLHHADGRSFCEPWLTGVRVQSPPIFDASGFIGSRRCHAPPMPPVLASRRIRQPGIVCTVSDASDDERFFVLTEVKQHDKKRVKPSLSFILEGFKNIFWSDAGQDCWFPVGLENLTQFVDMDRTALSSVVDQPFRCRLAAMRRLRSGRGAVQDAPRVSTPLVRSRAIAVGHTELPEMRRCGHIGAGIPFARPRRIA